MLVRIQKYRRDLHQIPELELELPKRDAQGSSLYVKLTDSQQCCGFF